MSSAIKQEFVKITPQAHEEVKKLVEKENKPGIGLRLGIKGGGCSGLSYDLQFTPPEASDTVIDFQDFKVYMDPKSLIYLKNMQLDFQGGLNGKGFVFSNPNASSTCGCGESFSVV
jgi:iron-sulfur cluster assembly protein